MDLPSAAPPSVAARRPIVLSVVSPTFNEAANLRPLAAALAAALGDTAWEWIVVDDDSPDGTVAAAVRLADEGMPVRAVRRVGRRGLASAVVEGALAARADIVAVIDADGQHDETLLPAMLAIVEANEADLVIGSRYVAGGSVGAWNETRQRMSALATWSARLLVGAEITDPMSGFFMTRRGVFDAAIYDLSQQGYKILLDLITASPRPLRIRELPYTFRDRREGESKVDALIIAEFAFLLIEKLTRGLVPPRLVLFSVIGGIGLVLHLAVLRAALAGGVRFVNAQLIATACAMALNYALNNAVTYRTDRRRGLRLVTGFLIFAVICSLGSIANIGVADLTMRHSGSWSLSGLAGATMSAVFNFGVSTRLVWGVRRRRRTRPAPPVPA